jgi:hypothetical protein
MFNNQECIQIGDTMSPHPFKGILKLVLTYIFLTRDEGCFFSI